jgi:hypothetical protein
LRELERPGSTLNDTLPDMECAKEFLLKKSLVCKKSKKEKGKK